MQSTCTNQTKYDSICGDVWLLKSATHLENDHGVEVHNADGYKLFLVRNCTTSKYLS